MKVNVSNVLTITDYTEDFVVWCTEHLILDNPEYAKKLQMGFYLGNTPKYIRLYEKRGDTLILPFGTLRLVSKLMGQNAAYSISFRNAPKIDFGGKDVPLYDYQQKAVESAFKSKYGILNAPAGSGKTQMGIALVKKYGRRTLWLTHTLDLLNQSKQRAEQYIDKSLIGTIYDGKVDIGGGITFATIQTMCKLDLSQYKDFWDVIIVDECHRAAGSPTQVTQFYKVLNSLAARHKYGLTATVHRSDGLIESTCALLGQVVYRVSDDEVGNKIMKVGIQAIATGVCASFDYVQYDGMVNYPKLISYLVKNEERNQIIIGVLETNSDKPSLLLSDRIDHLQTLMSLLPDDLKEQAVLISGRTKKEVREQAIEDMRSGKKKYMFATYSLAKEGLDIPILERLYLTTPKSDYAVIAQSVGRVARSAPGKGNPIAYDFIDNIGLLQSTYKKRCTTYRKVGCYFCE